MAFYRNLNVFLTVEFSALLGGCAGLFHGPSSCLDQRVGRVILARLSISTLCESNCPIVVVDSQIRTTRDELNLPGRSAAVEELLTLDDAVPVSRQVRSVSLGRYFDDWSVDSLSHLMVFRVEKNRPSGERVYGVAFQSAGTGARGWLLNVTCVNGRWAAGRPVLYFQP